MAVGDPQTWLGLAALLAAGLGFYWLLLVASTVLALVRPPRRTYAWAVSRGVPGDPAELPTPLAFTSRTVRRRGRELAVWEVEGGEPGGPVIVITHGWGSSRVGGLARLSALAPMASRVIMWDLPGHGESGGVCPLGAHEAGDLLAVLGSAGVDGRPVVLYGWSLGAEVTLDAAARMASGDGWTGGPAAGVVIEGAYDRGVTPARNVMRIARRPWRLNLGPALLLIGVAFGGDPLRRFRPLQTRRASRLGSPLLVLHGLDDMTCPIADGRAIAAAGGGTFEGIPGAGHHDVWEQTGGRAAAIDATRRWLDTVAAVRTPADATA